ncbi:hypothetical protein [Streptomyces scabiei]|uniref:hypothetical protein n=1 Tax=Streptomyces scabiei TaxID=1930 RepID=UPI00131D3B81|nr:hypothetical protein [Streptomyces scabiei]
MSGKSRPPASGLGYQAMQVDLGALVEGSSGGVLIARLAAYARPVDTASPYCVVNDYVSTAVGMAMGVPVPPGTLIKLGSEWGFVSVGFGEQGRRPPPADFEELGVDRPWEASGVVVLDQWISNSDRHDGNLAYLPTLGVAAFDHDQALFGACPPGEGVDSLQQARERRVKRHELVPYLKTVEHFESWINRAQSITHAELSRTAWSCVDAGLLTRHEADALVDFLEYRQLNIGRFIEESHSEFSGVTAWPLDSGGE